MKLRRESSEEVQEDTVEYKSAVKSVIRCQIQTLLQKLAIETGEESIVISTNVAAGTYNHLGSNIGREYLDDGDESVQSICHKFTVFCAEMQNVNLDSGQLLNDATYSGGELSKRKGRKSTLPPPKLTPRKRPLSFQITSMSPPQKRRPDQYSSDSGGLYTSQISERNPYISESDTSLEKGNDSNEKTGTDTSQLFQNESSHVDKDSMEHNVPWIKIEPSDDYSVINTNGNGSSELDDNEIGGFMRKESKSPKSIINRPKSLIPLANIFKRYGTAKVKKETISPRSEGPEKSILRSLYENQPIYNMADLAADAASKDINSQRADDPENLPSEKSILKSLYESQPIYNMGEFVSATNSDATVKDDGPNTPSLPTSVNESMEQYPSATENLVLSGYYDSDSYPTYRHRQKHPANTPSTAKKTKSKEKGNSGNNADTPVSNQSSADFHLRTFESGGRLVYACDVCKRELSHLTSYRRHMKLHTMERPHKCPVCDKGFIRKYHCIDHLNKHHKGIGFDADTLTLTGQNSETQSENPDQSALSESLSVSPGEYNYTLDQSLGVLSEADQSVNNSIDQSASTMLSELAKSVAQMAPHGQPGDNRKHEISQSEQGNLENIQSDCSSTNNQSNEDSMEMTSENSAVARKMEVNEGIKAIVAHLKSSSMNKKKKLSSELDVSPPPQVQLTADEVNS